MSKKAVILLSGGLDSTTALAVASKRDGYECHTLSFDYKQRHKIELEYAARQSMLWNCQCHHVINVSMDYIRQHNFDASLVRHISQVPVNRDESEMTDIPSTYVPARNTIFFSHAAALAEVIDAEAIYAGVNALDYSGYPDCRPEYIDAYSNMLSFATKKGVEGNPTKIITPLIDKTKAEIIGLGMALGVDYTLTTSCYNPKVVKDNNDQNVAVPCGVCDSCILRQKGFEEYNRRSFVGHLNAHREEERG